MLAGGPEAQWAPSEAKLEYPLEATRLQKPGRLAHAFAATAAVKGPEKGEPVEHGEYVEHGGHGEHETGEPEEEQVEPEEAEEPEGPGHRGEQLEHVVEPAL